VVSAGNFDGVHRGHQYVLRRVVQRARALDATALALTFEPHPNRILHPDVPKRLLTPLPVKLHLLQRCGLDAVLVLPFTRDLSLLSPREFAENILASGLHVCEVHEGSTFHFGRHAEGNVRQLADLGRELGFPVEIYPQMSWRSELVSSSRIRTLLAEGRVESARALLARPFSMVSTAGRGRGYGHRYTVPTINLARYEEQIPANGVYITWTRIGAECFDSVTNVGARPTFGDESFAVESHLLNFHALTLAPDTEVEVFFLRRLRAEIKFPSIAALRDQIAKDVQKAQRYLRAYRNVFAPQRRQA